MLQNPDEYYMRLALGEAKAALQNDEVPIGAIVVCNGKIIGKGYNQVEQLIDATAHAEMLAITAASNYLGSKFLENCTLYVTLEPCLMCATAIKWSRVENLVFGALDEKAGFSKYGDNILHPKTTVKSGVLADECALLLKQFFSEKRK
jgi:tRNA(adenine34) deaminase